MNRHQLAEKVSTMAKGTNPECTTAVCSVVLSHLFPALVEATKTEDVVINNFGTFMQKTRASRLARNPSTGEKVQVPAKKVFRLKTSYGLSKLINS